MEAVSREAVLGLVRDYAHGELDQSAFAAEVDTALQQLVLYPPALTLDLGQAAGQILEAQPESAVNAVLQLMSSECRETRAMTGAIISRLARFNPSIWAGIVRHLAADESWEVREFAAHAYDSREGYSGAIEFHQEYVLEELAGWATDANYLLRYAATQALLGGIHVNEQLIPRLLELLNPLLNDASEYVRTGHVIALRAMGRQKPEAVLRYIELHLPAKSDDIHETFRQVLDHPFADKLPERKQELLSKLGAG